MYHWNERTSGETVTDFVSNARFVAEPSFGHDFHHENWIIVQLETTEFSNTSLAAFLRRSSIQQRKLESQASSIIYKDIIYLMHKIKNMVS